MVGEGTDTVRFHFLGLAHIPTRRGIQPCAYTQKIIKLCKMLAWHGHEVIFYGVQDSEVECSEFVPVLGLDRCNEVFGNVDWRSTFFNIEGDDGWREFNDNAIREINHRKRKGDILLCPWGYGQKPVAEETGLLSVEPGIGYEGIFSDHKVFESYAWMHYIYGRINQTNGHWYDVVIPNYFDPDDFPYCEQKENYYLFIGRLTQRKGIDIAVQITREIGAELIVAGQGSLVNPREKLNITDAHVEHVGTVGAEARAQLMGKARAVFAPTYYIEPFGGVAVEAMMCGTPVITTDWGAYSETVDHGRTGYRCRTFDDFLWAAVNAPEEIDSHDCRVWAIENYSMRRVALMYEEYWKKLADLWRSGWYELHPEREALSWLRRIYGRRYANDDFDNARAR